MSGSIGGVKIFTRIFGEHVLRRIYSPPRVLSGCMNFALVIVWLATFANLRPEHLCTLPTPHFIDLGPSFTGDVFDLFFNRFFLVREETNQINFTNI